ncbi:histidine phosphatase family protein [Gordonia sp. LSe1-13]|uniref:Histidine phosphatase family protein n=1 Tax=Gordonia sesuvii TaxID=3116777 RepID=A0ABU7MFH8_9ACTN|nr:histidine phosphatase family protein [Gordonia sp. LSe1-13]
MADGRYGTVDVVVSSPSRRAVATASAAAAALAVEIDLDDRLVELSHGWTTYGIAHTYTDRATLLHDMNSGRLGDNTFDLDAFRSRVVTGIESLVTEADRVVAVVCHGGVINAYLSHVIGAEKMFFTEPYYTSVSRVLALPDGYRQVLSINEIDHLR